MVFNTKKLVAMGIVALSLTGCTQSSLDIPNANGPILVETTEAVTISPDNTELKSEASVDDSLQVEDTKVTYGFVKNNLIEQYPGLDFVIYEDFHTVQNPKLNAVYKRGLAKFADGTTLNFDVEISSDGSGPDPELNETGWNISHNFTEKYLLKAFHKNESYESGNDIEIDPSAKSASDMALRADNMAECRVQIEGLLDTFILYNTDTKVIRYQPDTDLYYVYDTEVSSDVIKAYKLNGITDEDVYNTVSKNRTTGWFVQK